MRALNKILLMSKSLILLLGVYISRTCYVLLQRVCRRGPINVLSWVGQWKKKADLFVHSDKINKENAAQITEYVKFFGQFTSEQYPEDMVEILEVESFSHGDSMRKV